MCDSVRIVVGAVVALLMVMVVGRTRSQLRRELELPSIGPMPTQLCSSSTTTVTHSFTAEYVALTLKGHPVFACTQTAVLRVLSGFLKRKVSLRGPTVPSPALQS
jgi:hypothetical protein